MTARQARLFQIGVAAAAMLVAVACGSDSSGPHDDIRTYAMGFSNFPPAPDVALQSRAVHMWITRADAAIMHIDPPWAALLAGANADSLVQADVLPISSAYESAGKPVYIELDVTNGIDRSAESPALVTLGRSIAEDTVQKLYVNYVEAVAAVTHSSYIGLASETNLIRLAAQPAVYTAVVAMTNAAAARVRADELAPFLYVSVQAEVAWGRLGAGGSAYVGIAQDVVDFPFINLIGVSSYPYLGGFADPADVPDDYYWRIASDAGRPMLITEGGWSSADIGSVHSSPALQRAWILRESMLLDNARAIAWFQLDFTDFSLAAFGLPTDDPQLVPFAHIGLVDTALTPKPALGAWDDVYARPYQTTLCPGGCLPSPHRSPSNDGAHHF